MLTSASASQPVSDAIPLFAEVFVPALAPLEPLTRLPAYSEAIKQAAGVRRAGFDLARQFNGPLAQLLGPAAAEVSANVLRDAEAVASLGDQIPEVCPLS